MNWFEQSLDRLNHLARSTQVTDKNGRVLSMETSYQFFESQTTAIGKRRHSIFLIGNGGSAAIASHIAIDFQRRLKLAAQSLSDISTITCLANDTGYENAYSEQIKLRAKAGDLIVAISSSGESGNILQATQVAKKQGLVALTLSGFRSSNRLRSMGTINVYVPSLAYGEVEVLHHAWLHAFVDRRSRHKLAAPIQGQGKLVFPA